MTEIKTNTPSLWSSSSVMGVESVGRKIA